MSAAVDLADRVGVRPACTALGVARPSFYRRRHPKPSSKPRPQPALALSATAEQAVLDTLHSERFVNDAPAEVHAALLDEGIYHCSARTMYRVLARHREVRERRRQLVHPAAPKPELLATAPNQVWSWDITKLLGPAKWTYFYLYVLMDIFSRYVVGWLVADGECSSLAQRLISESAAKQAIEPGQLTVHSDRGPSMTSKGVAQMLADLGITKTHSRPYTSNDNPFSEALFKTTKYRPEFPDRFATQAEATDFGRVFFPWYNTQHHHSGLGFLTPEVVHHGEAERLIAIRRAALQQAFALNPHRFKGRQPAPPQLPAAVYINPPTPRVLTLAEKSGAHTSPTTDDRRRLEGDASTSNGAAAALENQSPPLAAIH